MRLYLDDPARADELRSCQQVDGDHGRIETRRATVCHEVAWLRERHDWPGLAAFGKIEARRETARRTTTETRYYIMSAPLSPERFQHAVRTHWAIENCLHWVLDVTMNEDRQRNRKEHGPENLAMLRRLALNIARREPTKDAMRGKLKRAAWNDDFPPQPDPRRCMTNPKAIALGRDVVADFGGGAMTSDAGALLLGATDRAIGLVDRFAACFSDGRAAGRVVHDVATLVGQRVFGIALGYEDLLDHDELRHDPVLGTVLGRLEARRRDCAPLAGKSTLNRLEHAPVGAHRYRRIGHDAGAIEALFVDLFLDAHERAPERLVLDLDATDDPLHGRQEGRFFHGYYDCYCYLPLYIFCGDHLLAAKLRRANIDASAGAVEEVERIVGHIRARWPAVEIVLRADSASPASR